MSTWQTVYISNGYGYFADHVSKTSDEEMKTWLEGKRDELTADDALQAWIDKNGGNDLEKASDVSVISYPFKSGTTRYPNDTAKWAALAHEICPDDDASDYAKAYNLFVWMQNNIAYDRDYVNEGPYRWAVAAQSSTAKGFTMWDSHIGMCMDFVNAYAIMCRELGIPCHALSDSGHTWNIIYLNGRWEIVDVNMALRNAYVGTDNKAYAENVKAYWEKQATQTRNPILTGFCAPAYSHGELKIASYETDKYTSITDKINKVLLTIDIDIMNASYFTRRAGTVYGH